MGLSKKTIKADDMAVSELPKQGLCSNVLIPVPDGFGSIIQQFRSKQNLIQKQLSDRLLMRGRSAISEYENESTKITERTWSLLAIALNFHPNLPAGVHYDKPLVFETNPVPQEGYAGFLQRALDKQGVSKNSLCLSAKISHKKLASYLEGNARPTAEQWSRMQLTLNEFACGVNLPDILSQQRALKGWSQEDVAGIIGVNPQSISNYESRKSIPGNHVWSLLMLAYDIHPNYSLEKRVFTGDREDYLRLLD